MPVNNYMPKSLENMNAYDMENATEFLPTLKSYIFNLKNTKETASELHIHRNTLLYRINKIEELFGITLDTAEDFHHHDDILHAGFKKESIKNSTFLPT